MARDERMDARLRRWAEWLKVGDGDGYATVCVLHENWSPPTPGTTPTLKVSTASREVRETDRLVHRMSERLQATVAAHYLLGMSAADAAQALGCAPDTVLGRIERAHRWMLGELEQNQPGVFATTEN